MTAAVSDMETAYNDAAGRTNPDGTNLYDGLIGGNTFAPGLYKWSAGVIMSSDVTLSGGADDVWIFQIAKTFINSADVILAGSARPENIFWVVAEATTLNASSHTEGIILDQTGIVMDTGASIHGRLLAQTAVTLISNTVTEP